MVLAVAASLLVVSCGDNARLFSDEFRNFVRGDVVPLTPGEPSQFVLVRLVNDTPDAIEFVVTAERQVLITDEQGVGVIESTTETVRLRTLPLATANEVGALFDCPVTRIGLGEDLNQPFSEPGLFVLEGGGENLGVQAGFGVPSNVPPLDSPAGNFGCGDTIVFRVIESRLDVGNIKVQPFVLPAASQPEAFLGPHTFNNARIFLEGQTEEDG
jgi:hypothetical protein